MTPILSSMLIFVPNGSEYFCSFVRISRAFSGEGVCGMLERDSGRRLIERLFDEAEHGRINPHLDKLAVLVFRQRQDGLRVRLLLDIVPAISPHARMR